MIFKDNDIGKKQIEELCKQQSANEICMIAARMALRTLPYVQPKQIHKHDNSDYHRIIVLRIFIMVWIEINLDLGKSNAFNQPALDDYVDYSIIRNFTNLEAITACSSLLYKVYQNTSYRVPKNELALSLISIVKSTARIVNNSDLVWSQFSSDINMLIISAGRLPNFEFILFLSPLWSVERNSGNERWDEINNDTQNSSSSYDTIWQNFIVNTLSNRYSEFDSILGLYEKINKGHYMGRENKHMIARIAILRKMPVQWWRKDLHTVNKCIGDILRGREFNYDDEGFLSIKDDSKSSVSSSVAERSKLIKDTNNRYFAERAAKAAASVEAHLSSSSKNNGEIWVDAVAELTKLIHEGQ